MTDAPQKNTDDIRKLRKLLKYRKSEKIADLLAHSHSVVNESSTFGSRWYSTLSTFEIYSPLKQHEELMKLNVVEQNAVLTCLHTIYPIKESAPEITGIEFFPDVDLISDSELVEPEKLEKVSYDFIQDQIRKCREKVESGDHDGAVTNSRTLIEATCLFILEQVGNQYQYKGKLNQLYAEVSKILGMDAGQVDNDNLKKIISGAVNIVDGMGGLRNAYSDAHGLAPKRRYKLDRRHTVLVVNLAKSISEFLYSSWDETKAKKAPPSSTEPSW